MPPGFAGNPQPHGPDRPCLQIASRRCRGVGRVQGDARTLQEQLSGGSQVDPTRVALEQLDPELCFEPPDLRRQSGLGDPQTLCGAR